MRARAQARALMLFVRVVQTARRPQLALAACRVGHRRLGGRITVRISGADRDQQAPRLLTGLPFGFDFSVLVELRERISHRSSAGKSCRQLLEVRMTIWEIANRLEIQSYRSSDRYIEIVVGGFAAAVLAASLYFYIWGPDGPAPLF